MDRKGRGVKGVVRVLVVKAPGHLELVVKVRVRIYQAAIERGRPTLAPKHFWRFRGKINIYMWEGGHLHDLGMLHVASPGVAQ